MNGCRLVRPVEGDNHVNSILQRVDKISVAILDISVECNFLDVGLLLHLDEDSRHLNISQFCAAQVNLFESIHAFRNVFHRHEAQLIVSDLQLVYLCPLGHDVEEVDTLVNGQFCPGQVQVVNLKENEFKIDHQNVWSIL